MAICLEIIRSALDYDPSTGKLTWKGRPREDFETSQGWKVWNTKYPGKEALKPKGSGGYRAGKLQGRYLAAHRAAFACMGEDMPEAVDHINGDRGDNRWANLRASSYKKNNRNRAMHKNNASGVMGVFFEARSKTWVAKLSGKVIARSKEKAHAIAARHDALNSHTGYSLRHGSE